MKQFNKLHLTLFIILAIDAMNFGIVIPVLPKLFLGDSALLVSVDTTLAVRYSLMGLVLGLYPLAVCLGTPLLSIASDRYGRKPILFLSLLGTFIGLTFSAFALFKQSVNLLMLSRILLGIFSASQPIATAAIADISREKNRPYYFSLVALAMTVGMLAGPLLGGFLADDHLWIGFSLYTPFIAASLLAITNIIFMVLFYQETLPAATYQLSTFSQYLKSCKGKLIQPDILNLLIIFILLEMAWSLFFQTEPTLLANNFTYSSEMQSLYITFLGIIMCFGLAILFKPLNAKICLAKLSILSLWINVTGFIILIFFHQAFVHWLAPMTFTLGVGICYTCVVSQLSLRVLEGEQGWLMGFMATLLALSWAVTGFIGPRLININENMPVVICALLTLATLPFSYKMVHFKYIEISLQDAIF